MFPPGCLTALDGFLRRAVLPSSCLSQNAASRSLASSVQPAPLSLQSTCPYRNENRSLHSLCVAAMSNVPNANVRMRSNRSRAGSSMAMSSQAQSSIFHSPLPVHHPSHPHYHHPQSSFHTPWGLNGLQHCLQQHTSFKVWFPCCSDPVCFTSHHTLAFPIHHSPNPGMPGMSSLGRSLFRTKQASSPRADSVRTTAPEYWKYRRIAVRLISRSPVGHVRLALHVSGPFRCPVWQLVLWTAQSSPFQEVPAWPSDCATAWT